MVTKQYISIIRNHATDVKFNSSLVLLYTVVDVCANFFLSLDEPRARNSGTWDDPSPLRTGGSLGRPQGHGGGGGSGGGTPVRHHGAGHGHGGMMTPQRSSEDSWCSGSEPELSSDDESDRSAASSTR